MKLLLVLLASFAVTFGGIIPYLDHRIVGGIEIEIKDRPYQVALFSKGKFNCGGSILNNNTILTAAHCVKRFSAANVTVRVGNTYYNKGKLNKVAEVIVHKHYNKIIKDDYDIAILKLVTPLTFSNTVKPIELYPASSPPVIDGTRASVSGWGLIKEKNATLPNKLRRVHVNVMNNKKCQRKYKSKIITKNMLCAQVPNKDSCQGDSGGPLVANKKLIGVVSWGNGCARHGYPGVYANIYTLRDFITKNS